MTNAFSGSKRPILELVGQLLLIASMITAAMQTIGMLLPIPFSQEILAGLPIGLIALFVLANIKNINHLVLFAILAAAAIGSAFMPSGMTSVSLIALIAFSAYLVLLLLLFIANRTPFSELATNHLNMAGMISAAAMIFAIWIIPDIKDGLLLYGGYSLLLLVVAVCAVISRFHLRLMVSGIIMVVASNALLLMTNVQTLPTYMPQIIWVLFYIGQLFLTLGVMLAEERPYLFSKYRF